MHYHGTDAYWKAMRKADKKLQIAKSRGKLTPASQCERCPSTARLDGHHSDYREPLSVVWLCPKCHRQEHKRLRDAGQLVPH